MSSQLVGYLTIYSLPIKFELNLNDGAHGEVREVAILGVPNVLARQPKIYLQTMRIIMTKKMTMIIARQPKVHL